jgi:hypothetical protein
MKNKLFFALTVLFLAGATHFSSAQEKKINVFDTLCKQKFFEDHSQHDMKANYDLDKKGFLKREVSFTADALHYHKAFEDSIYHFLKKTYPKNFHGLVFYAKEDVDWTIGGGGKPFTWKAGKKIDHHKLSMVLSSDYEVQAHAKRAGWLQKEQDVHLFFHNYFLLDSVGKNIYCFNNLGGLMDGQINFDANGNTAYEVAYYDNRKMFYEFRKDLLEIFSAEGKKLFERTAGGITGYNENEEVAWTYSLISKTATFGDAVKKDFNIDSEYYKKIEALWRSNFAK